MSIRELQNGAFQVPPDGGTMLWVLGHFCEIKATKEQTRDSYALMDAVLAPHLMAAPPHYHHDREEGFYVLDGTVRVTVGDETIDAPAGTFLFVPRGTVHAFGNESDGTARVIVIGSPGGDDKFFEEIGEPAPERRLPPPPQGPPDIGKLMEAAQRHGMELVGGPPLGAGGSDGGRPAGPPEHQHPH